MARLTGALLALTMIAGPALARVQAAETCRLRCSPAAEQSEGGCCGYVAKSHTQGERAGEHHDGTSPAGEPSDASLKHCPGCNGRPLVSGAPRLTLTLDPAPMLAPPVPVPASASFDVPFSIFHPPRA